MRIVMFLALAILAACDDREPVAATGLVVFIGDSITYSWPVEDYVVGAVKAGESGEETPQTLQRFERDVLSRQPVAVVILGGINDILKSATSDTSSLMIMAQQARAANIRVVVGTLPAVKGFGAESGTRRVLIEIFNDQIRMGAAAYGYEVADYYAVTKMGRWVDTRWFPDGLHPNSRGYELMWTALKPALQRQGVLRDES